MAGRSKRKLEDFDPTKSDSDDENYDESPTKRTSRKSTKSKKKSSRPKKTKRSRTKYSGSDIEEDSEDFSESSLGDNFDQSEEEEVERTQTGRPLRRTVKAVSTFEEPPSREDTPRSVSPDTEPDAAQKNPPVVDRREGKLILKVDPDRLAKVTPARTTRAGSRALKEASLEPANRPRRTTRAHTEEGEELIALSVSGRHAVVQDSVSPDGASRTRPTRGTKGLKKPFPPVIEATQESTILSAASQDDPDQMDVDDEESGKNDDREIPDSHETKDETFSDDELAQNYPPKPPTPEPLSDDDEDAIVVHGRRRVNSGVETAETVEDVENAENVDPVSSTVLIDPAEAAPTGGRQLRQRKPFPKIAGEPTSDFEPDDEESERDEDLDDSDAAPKKRRGSRSTASPRRRTGRRGGRSGGNSRKHSGSDSEEALPDPDEVADELNELKPGRRPRRRVVRHFDDDIDYGRGARRARQPVDYSIKPLTEVFAADEEAEENAPPSPARGGRKNNGPSKGWERTLHSAFGPFGGGNPITPITGAGPWGQEAAGGADSDSSDDDLIDAPRPSISGPSTGMPNLLPGLTQAIPLEPAGATAGNPANFGKVKSQKALADADPLGVDKDVDFSKVGGLAGHIDQLKEMVQMPLLYPELFLKFHVTPPRGVLFHGPPGTGKTLLARALAASVGTNGRKITFYMRKGADALSKWVGEAERQLRLLFEEARKTQPSIIFFDEIDGLAPVRSSKQEQIHASIVSTLLALMDGMDGRGQVIVIGATNRPDNIDPALRRPGRFDREFYFPLPDREGRRSIIDIHTRDWGLNDDFKDNLAKVTKGYGGADLRALTTEAALNAIQRTYPQIYSSNDKLVVDPEKIKITAKDFMLSVKKMVPSSERAASSGARPLPKVVEPLLIEQLQSIEGVLDSIVPLKKKLTALQEAMYEQYDDEDQGFGRETMQQDFERSRVFRPRLLIQGGPGMGQAYIGSALLNHFEGLHVQIFDIATIYGDNTKSPEAAVVQMFAEVKRHKPSVIYLPDVDSSWASMSESVIKTFLGLLRGIPATDPVLVLGISDQDPPDQSMIRDLFGLSRKNRFNLAAATEDKRADFFRPILEYIAKQPKDFPEPLNRKLRKLEQLEIAPPPPPRELTKEEKKAIKQRDHQLLNILKMHLQPIMDQIQKKYRKFRTPAVQPHVIQYLFEEQDPNYVKSNVEQPVQFRPYELAKDKEGRPGLLETATGRFFYNLETTLIEERLSNGYYARPKDWLADIRSLVSDAKHIAEKDRDRYMKGKEMLTNVEVDVAMVEANPQLADCEGLYLRQLQRTKEKEEKRKKKEAEAALVTPAREGPIDLTGAHSGPAPNFQSYGTPASGEMQIDVQHSFGSGRMSNGSSIPSTRNPMSDRTSSASIPSTRNPGSDRTSSATSGNDTQMSGTDEHPNSQSLSQPLSQGHYASQNMLPPTSQSSSDPSQASQPSQSSQGSSTPHATQVITQANTQYSQFTQTSAFQSIPHGISPRDLINDASTTNTTTSGKKTEPSQPSTRHSNGSTQLTNGQQEMSQFYSPPRSYAGSDGAMPDTQDPNGSQGDGGWAGSQRDQVMGTPHSLQAGARQSVHSQRFIPVDDRRAKMTLENFTRRTSDFTVEELEMIYRECMNSIWELRGFGDRMHVLGEVESVFIDTVEDILASREDRGEAEPAQSRRDLAY